MSANDGFLIIGNLEVPKIISYKIGQNKLYAADSGRDLAGTNHATLIGIYPKIEISVGSYTSTEMRDFLNAVNKYPLSIQWFDEQTGTFRKGEDYYINDFTIELNNTKTRTYKEFNFNLVPNKKKS